MSEVEGLDDVLVKLSSLDRLAKQRLDKAVDIGARQMQADMVALAPRRTGRLSRALASPDAIEIKTGKGGRLVAVGINTKQQKRDAFYGLFVEFGTKGYVAGQTRQSGRDKKGKMRWRRIKRNIPARPAHPFYRPALANLKRNMERLRKEAWALATADMLIGR